MREGRGSKSKRGSTTWRQSRKRLKKAKTEVSQTEDVPVFRSRAERIAAGKALRDAVPRTRHADWKPPASRRDPIAILEESNEDRLPELAPIRFGRMLASPFTFLRGSAALMAADLATTPASGLRVQACGDCHVLNFGLFATPERNLVFDLNDFDETLPAPWEWDLKRLAVSIVVAGRAITSCPIRTLRMPSWSACAPIREHLAGVFPAEAAGSLVHPPGHGHPHRHGAR